MTTIVLHNYYILFSSFFTQQYIHRITFFHNPQTLFLSTVITLFMYCFTCCFYSSVVSIASCSPIVSCTITAFCTFIRCCSLLPLSPYECYVTYNTVLTPLFNFYWYCYQGRMQDFLRGGPNFKISGIMDIHAAKRHVANSEAASLC